MGKNPAQKAKSTENKGESKKVEGRKAKEAKKKPAKKATQLVAKRSERKCLIAKCKRAYRAKGYCRVHYKKWRQGAYGRARYKTCYDHGCLKPMVENRHGYCEEHYQNYYVKGMDAPKAPAAAPAPQKQEKKESVA